MPSCAALTQSHSPVRSASPDSSAAPWQTPNSRPWIDPEITSSRPVHRQQMCLDDCGLLGHARKRLAIVTRDSWVLPQCTGVSRHRAGSRCVHGSGRQVSYCLHRARSCIAGRAVTEARTARARAHRVARSLRATGSEMVSRSRAADPLPQCSLRNGPAWPRWPKTERLRPQMAEVEIE
jgi:hypothetical protein